MGRLVMVSLCCVILFGVTWTSAAQKQASGNLSKIMTEKLSNSKNLLEGIAVSDFNKISRSAENLIQLSKTADWFVFQTPRYELHSNEFRRAAENIVQKAKDKNLDGVTLAYFELTMGCVRCHKYVREVRDARLPLPLDKAAAPAAE
jgi:hypothetical protein